MTYTILHTPTPPHEHNLPDCDTEDTVIRCDPCGALLVLKWRDGWDWVPLRWYHRTAHHGLRTTPPPTPPTGGIQIDRRATARTRSQQEHPAGRTRRQQEQPCD